MGVITATNMGSGKTKLAKMLKIPVDGAEWSKAGKLDWWVKERQEWLGRLHGADGRQRWIKAVDLRPASGSQ